MTESEAAKILSREADRQTHRVSRCRKDRSERAAQLREALLKGIAALNSSAAPFGLPVLLEKFPKKTKPAKGK